MSERCTNCDARDAEAYDLMLRGDDPTEAYLCDACREALKEAVEMA